MPLDFPENPVLNQIYPYNSIRWKWNGYAWDSSGVCGSYSNIGGICGDYVERITDGIGITLSSSTGVVEVSLRLDEPNIGPQNTQVLHNAPTSFSAESGFARKVAFLQSDGSISFDYIKNYDVFRKAEFEFDIVGFNVTNAGNPINPVAASLIGSNLLLSGYQGNIQYNQTPISAQITILNATPSQQSNFPVTINSLGFTTVVFSNQTLLNRQLTYAGANSAIPNSDYYGFRVGATGQNSDGTLVYKTKDYNVYFYNYIFWSVRQGTSISSLDNTFVNFLSGDKNIEINTDVTVDQQNPYYLYVAYPSRLGTATFRDNSTNLEGGFTPQQNPISYTNQFGYIENYTVYRSDNGNLGNISITVT